MDSDQSKCFIFLKVQQNRIFFLHIYLHMHFILYIIYWLLVLCTYNKKRVKMFIQLLFFSESDGQKKQGRWQILEDPNTQKSTIIGFKKINQIYKIRSFQIFL